MSTRRLPWPLVVMAVVGIIVVASCQPPSGQVPPDSLLPGSTQICDGISGDVGGCEPRHSFTGATCSALAEEWAREMDRRIVPIVRDPKQDSERAASVLLRQVLVVVTSDMNSRFIGAGITEDCDVPAFLAAAEPHLSEELKDGVGELLYDGAPQATYQEWLEDVQRVLRMIEERDQGTGRSSRQAA